MIELIISDKAKEELKKISLTSKCQWLRLTIASYSCCDINFTIVPSNEKKDQEEIIKSEELLFVIDEDLALLFKKFEIDYEEGVFKKGFNIQAYRRE